MNSGAEAADGRALWFAVRGSRLRRRADPGYAAASLDVDRRYAVSKFPLHQLGELVVEVQYGTSARPESSGDVRVVRMGNLRDDALDLTEYRWVSLPQAEIARYRLQPGDILFNRTNSKDLVGKSAVFSDDGAWVFASYLIRVRVDAERVLPEFVAAFLNSPAGRLQIDRDSRQIIGMANVNARELRELLIPLPPFEYQKWLLQPVLDARNTAAHARRSLSSVDAELDRRLVQRLDVTVSDPEQILSFTVRKAELRGRRLDASAYLPAVQSEDARTRPIRRLEELAEINPKRDHPALINGLVPYVGLPECGQRAVREVALRDPADPIGRNVAVVGDILFARIEPSVFNRKYVFVEDLHGHSRVLVSGEFYVVRADPDMLDQRYLHEVLLSSIIAPQVRGKTTGSSGRRRIDRGLFAALALPVPRLAEQRLIAEELHARRVEVEAAWRKAVETVAEEVQRFDRELLPSS